MELVIISIFCVILIACVIFNISIIFALVAGLMIFCFYGRLKGFTFSQLAKMITSGFRIAKNILIVFVLIGMMTALWRACGTIPVIIAYVTQLVSPGALVLTTFLLNCIISVLTGTALGTAATMGVICMTMAVSMGMPPIIIGGAVLSGAYFGDRCSPVSTSALLVCELTATNIFDNIVIMIRSAIVPFLLTCAVYAVIGLCFTASGNAEDLRFLFSREFNLYGITLLPAIIILVLSIFRINVKISMTASIIMSLFICFFAQHLKPLDILRFIAFGYSAKDLEIAELLNGGGILSMIKVMGMVLLSSAYVGVFQQTGILIPVKRLLIGLSNKITPFGAIFFTSVVAAMVTCSQALAIILTHQLFNEIETDSQKLAIDLENTAVVVSGLIPWSIACAVPLASAGAPISSLIAACFLYILPIYSLLINVCSKKQRS